MKYLQFVFLLFSLTFMVLSGVSQTPDSTQTTSTFSGTVGITNNGFSIIPTFSLNHPAAIMNFSWRKKRVSFEPDIRLVPDASKGGLIFWVRYRLIEQKKFSLRVGAHPAFTLIHSSVTDNGNTKEITEMLRFLAFEVVPSYQITPHVGVSAMYLQGNALQKHGPQLTRVLFLNTAFTDISLSKNLYLNIFPTVFFLNTDGYKGSYFTATVAVGHKKSPLSLQSTINQTFSSNVPGNQNFMWNIALNYHFKRKVIGN